MLYILSDSINHENEVQIPFLTNSKSYFKVVLLLARHFKYEIQENPCAQFIIFKMILLLLVWFSFSVIQNMLMGHLRAYTIFKTILELVTFVMSDLLQT